VDKFIIEGEDKMSWLTKKIKDIKSLFGTASPPGKQRSIRASLYSTSAAHAWNENRVHGAPVNEVVKGDFDYDVPRALIPYFVVGADKKTPRIIWQGSDAKMDEEIMDEMGIGYRELCPVEISDPGSVYFMTPGSIIPSAFFEALGLTIETLNAYARVQESIPLTIAPDCPWSSTIERLPGLCAKSDAGKRPSAITIDP
jgi:hypothetical protein